MEEKVSATLLEESKKIVIAGETLLMSPPSIATLVLASKYIRQLPSKELSKERLISEMIQSSDRLTPLGNALSAMILGAKMFPKLEKITIKNFYKKRKTNGEVLAEKINEANIKEVLGSFFTILEAMNLTDFFQLTTFLIELNITKPTKRVGK